MTSENSKGLKCHSPHPDDLQLLCQLVKGHQGDHNQYPYWWVS